MRLQKKRRGLGSAIWIAMIAVCTFWCTAAAPLVLRDQSIHNAYVALGDRPFDGRLSMELPYLPRRDRAKAVFIRRSGDPRSNGIVQLLEGAHNESIAALSSSLSSHSWTASAASAQYNDLAVARFARYSSDKRRVDDLLLSLDNAERSWCLKPSPAALWNRTVAMSELELPDAGTSVWQDYLKLDSSTDWSLEANRKIKRRAAHTPAWANYKSILEKAPTTNDVLAAVAASPLQSRQFVEDHLAFEWSTTRDVARKKQLENAIVMVARALSARSKDETIADLAATMFNDQSPRDALLLFGKAREAYGSDAQKARGLFEDVCRIAPKKGPTMLAAQIYLAALKFRAGQSADALRLVRLARSGAVQNQYALLVAQSWWIEGLVRTADADYSAAVSAYDAAHASFADANERGAAAFVNLLKGENFRFAGDVDASWRTLLRTLPDAQLLDQNERRYLLLSELGKTAGAAGAKYAAIAIYDRAAVYAQEKQLYAAAADIAAARAEVAIEIGLPALANASLDLADQNTRRVINDVERRRVQIDVSISRADALCARDPHQSLQILEQAIDSLRTTQQLLKLGKALLFKANAQIQLGNRKAAETTLIEGLDELQRQSIRLDTRPARLLFQQSARPLADALVRMRWDEGRFTEALDATERIRGASNRFDNAALPSASTCAVYYTLQNDVLVWIVSNHGVIAAYKSLAGLSELQTTITELEATIADGDEPRSYHLLESLYTSLLSPAPDLHGNELVIVPDEAFIRVPFSALRNAKTKRFLVDDVAVRMAFSLGSVVENKKIARKESQILITAASDGGEYLPEVQREIVRLTALLRGQSVQVLSKPTRQTLLPQMTRAAVFHYAGHASVVPGDQAYGRLLIGRDLSETLSSGEIADLDLSGLQLAVLSACDTAATNGTRSGNLTLVRAFLEGGARTSIGTTYPVRDAAARAFSAALYRHLLEGESVAVATRAAQHELRGIGQFSKLRNWASFQVWGTGASLNLSRS